MFVSLADKPIGLYVESPKAVKKRLDTYVRWTQWAEVQHFEAKSGHHLPLPGEYGQLDGVLVVMDDESLRWTLGGLAKKLPKGDYTIMGDWSDDALVDMAIGWGLGCYQYTRYTSAKPIESRLVIPERLQHKAMAVIRAFSLVRDLINTPAGDLMPEHLADAAKNLAEEYSAQFEQIQGEPLRSQYPALHTVGRASDHPPQLLRLRWGNIKYPRLVLVGKGVCFDTGGLDIKPSQYMRTMKKDMGGAAHVLGLAQWIMQEALPVRLEVIVSAADNAISGDAFRPGDVIQTSAGISVEVDNTDAEGRLVMCEALHEAGKSVPDLMLDFATLTGAARVALGTEVPVFFTNRSDTQTALSNAAMASDELIWPLPLYEPYAQHLSSDIADIANSASVPFGGAITAGLFLQKFVGKTSDWVHFDVMAWNNRARPGRPKGGEAMGLFAVMHYLKHRYAE